MHQKTADCVAKAEKLLESRDVDSLRYASLQLRMAIEYLFYELIPRYADELPMDIVNKWQPQRILEALVACDPDVDKDSTLVIREELAGRSVSKPVFQGSQKAVNKSLLKKHYHRLGSSLHATMVNKKSKDIDKWHASLLKTVDVLKEYKTTDILSNFGVKAVFDCECGLRFKRKVSAIRLESRVSCPDPQCGAVYECEFDDNDQITPTLDQRTFDCPHCKTQNFIGAHHLSNGVEVNCVDCDKKSSIRIGFCAVQLDGKLAPLGK